MSGFAYGQPKGRGGTTQQTLSPLSLPWVPAPVAGADYTLTLQQYDDWRLVAASFTLTTDDTDGDRYVQVQYLDGTGTPLATDPSTYAHAASTTVDYSAALDGLVVQDGASTVVASFRLSGLWLIPGRQVVLHVDGIGAADAFTDLRLTFDRTIVHDDGSELIRERELAQRIAAELGELPSG